VVGRDAVTQIRGRERREVDGPLDLVTLDDSTHRARGNVTTIVGEERAKRSYTLHVDGEATILGSRELVLTSDKTLTLKVGESSITITKDKIELSSPAIVTKSGQASLSLSEETLTAKTKKSVEIISPAIALTSRPITPDPAKKPPTLIELKDASGKPLAHQRFVIDLDDGSQVAGKLDENGKAEIALETDVSGKIRFPDVQDVKSA
jgi:hypothetical protein